MQCIIWCWRGKMEEYQYKNTSLAIFLLLYSDPYNNTFGEKNWLIILFVIFSTICCIVSIYLMIGIVMFGSFSGNINRTFLDRVSKKCRKKPLLSLININQGIPFTIPHFDKKKSTLKVSFSHHISS